MPDPGTMQTGFAPLTADLLQLALPSSNKKVVLVMDLVESVRLMASDEPGTVRRWLEFTRQAQDKVIPAHQGRLVKSLGDGLMVEFDQPQHAVAAAQALHDLLGQGNAALPPSKHMHLRAGINSSHVYSDAHDIYGVGVNLTSRLASLAQPGETVISAGVRDELTDGLDTCVEDLGDCYVKHVEQPVRAYKISPVTAVPQQQDQTIQLLPTIAVIPFEARSAQPEHQSIGELIAEGTIAQLSRSGKLNIISRLSTTVFRHRNMAVVDIASHLGANYVLSGSYVVNGAKLMINTELAQADNGHVAWSQRLNGSVEDLLQAESELSHQIAEAAHQAILDTEVKKTRIQSLPTLQSYTLMLGGISLMHKTTAHDFDRSRQILELLIERHRHAAATRAWLAMWYVLKTTRGLATDPARDAAEALDHTQRALDSDPDSSLALAMEGFVHCHLKKDPDTAWKRVDAALASDPNNSLAWLFMSTIGCLRGKTSDAVTCAQRAIGLSPLDPLRYYYLCLAGGAALFDGQWQEAADLSAQSWRLNRSHVATLRALVVSNSILGRNEIAKQYLKELLVVEPQLTVEKYLARSPGGFPFRERFAEAMAEVGLPRR